MKIFSHVVFFSVTFGSLVVVTLLSPQTRLVTISDITPSLFKHLHQSHGQTLSCPCSTISVPYQTFVSYTISTDPICTSFLTSRQWIEAFYLTDASNYLTVDFRKTAYSQVSADLSQRDITRYVQRERLS